MRIGGTFYFRAQKSPCEHLYVVISDHEKEKVVVVNFTKDRGVGYEKDEACIVEREEFPAGLTIRSWMRYDLATPVSRLDLARVITKNLGRAGPPVPPALLKKIQVGALASKNTSLECRRILESQGIEEPDDI